MAEASAPRSLRAQNSNRLVFKTAVNYKMDLLQGKSLMQKGSETVLADTALKKKNLILFYFTSNHCDVCRDFDLKLKEVYEEAVSRKMEIAVIVVCCDTDKENFTENIRSNYQEWFYIKYNDDLLRLLTYNYGVTHIPSLVVVRKNGAVVTKEGKSDVDKIGINVLVTWSE